ncbi:hypothetical protein NL676_008069 [Syzygium grande]|nr:hypothetical protein NL676_008069 [Syzygium grande]
MDISHEGMHAVGIINAARRSVGEKINRIGWGLRGQREKKIFHKKKKLSLKTIKLPFVTAVRRRSPFSVAFAIELESHWSRFGSVLGRADSKEKDLLWKSFAKPRFRSPVNRKRSPVANLSVRRDTNIAGQAHDRTELSRRLPWRHHPKARARTELTDDSDQKSARARPAEELLRKSPESLKPFGAPIRCGGGGGDRFRGGCEGALGGDRIPSGGKMPQVKIIARNFMDMVAALPAMKLDQLYQNAFICEAILRSLPPLAKKYVVQTLYIEEAVTAKSMEEWVVPDGISKHKVAIDRLLQLRIFSETFDR